MQLLVLPMVPMRILARIAAQNGAAQASARAKSSSSCEASIGADGTLEYEQARNEWKEGDDGRCDSWGGMQVMYLLP